MNSTISGIFYVFIFGVIFGGMMLGCFVWGMEVGKGKPVIPRKEKDLAQDDKKEMIEELKIKIKKPILRVRKEEPVQEIGQDDEQEKLEEDIKELEDELHKAGN